MSSSKPASVYAQLLQQHAELLAGDEQHVTPLSELQLPLILRPAFSLLQSIPLTHQVVAGSWCHTMDLLALLTADGTLSLQRLDAQKLWSAAVDTPLGSLMCWRPDGKVLAVGSATGSVTTYDVEHCRVLRVLTCRPPGGRTPSVCHLSWVHSLAMPPKSTYQQLFIHRHQRLFSHPPWVNDPKAAVASLNILDITSAPPPRPWQEPPKAMHCLVATTSAGDVVVFAYSRQQLMYLPGCALPSTAPAHPGELAANPASPPQTAGKLRASAHLTRDFNFLVTLGQWDAPGQGGAPGLLSVTVHHTGGFKQRLPELQQVVCLLVEAEKNLERPSS